MTDEVEMRFCLTISDASFDSVGDATVTRWGFGLIGLAARKGGPGAFGSP